VNFHLKQRILEAGQDLEVVFRPTDTVSSSQIYYFAIQHKEVEIFSEQIKLDGANGSASLVIPASQFPIPNGGVLTANLFNMNGIEPFLGKNTTRDKIGVDVIAQWYQPAGEAMFFVKPSEKLDVHVLGINEFYVPGEEVEFEVSVTDQEGHYLADNETYISVVVTDESVFSKVEERKQPPSLPAQVLLEHEVRHTNYQFYYSRDYVEHLYGEIQGSSDENLALLIGVQQWRRCIFCLPVIMEEHKEFNQKEDVEEKARVQNVFGVLWENIYNEDDDIMFDMAAADGAENEEKIAAPGAPPANQRMFGGRPHFQTDESEIEAQTPDDYMRRIKPT